MKSLTEIFVSYRNNKNHIFPLLLLLLYIIYPVDASLFNCPSEYREVSYTEDFSDGKPYSWESYNGTWEFILQSAIQTETSANCGISIFTRKKPITNYSIEIKLKAQEFTDELTSYGGIIFRMPSTNQGYGFIINKYNSYFVKYKSGNIYPLKNDFYPANNIITIGERNSPVSVVLNIFSNLDHLVQLQEYILSGNSKKSIEIIRKKGSKLIICDAYNFMKEKARDMPDKLRFSINFARANDIYANETNIDEYAKTFTGILYCLKKQSERKLWSIMDYIICGTAVSENIEIDFENIKNCVASGSYRDRVRETYELLKTMEYYEPATRKIVHRPYLLTINGHTQISKSSDVTSFDFSEQDAEDIIKKEINLNLREKNPYYGISTGYDISSTTVIRIDVKGTVAEAYINDKLVQRTDSIKYQDKGFFGFITIRASVIYDYIKIINGYCIAKYVSELPEACSCLLDAYNKILIDELGRKKLTFAGKDVDIYSMGGTSTSVSEYWIKIDKKIYSALQDRCEHVDKFISICINENKIYLGYLPIIQEIKITPEPQTYQKTEESKKDDFIAKDKPKAKKYCDDYCYDLGYYQGSCRADISSCNRRGEVYVREGWCPPEDYQDTCCCLSLERILPLILSITPTPVPKNLTETTNNNTETPAEKTKKYIEFNLNNLNKTRDHYIDLNNTICQNTRYKNVIICNIRISSKPNIDSIVAVKKVSQNHTLIISQPEVKNNSLLIYIYRDNTTSSKDIRIYYSSLDNRTYEPPHYNEKITLNLTGKYLIIDNLFSKYLFGLKGVASVNSFRLEKLYIDTNLNGIYENNEIFLGCEHDTLLNFGIIWLESETSTDRRILFSSSRLSRDIDIEILHNGPVFIDICINLTLTAISPADPHKKVSAKWCLNTFLKEKKIENKFVLDTKDIGRIAFSVINTSIVAPDDIKYLKEKKWIFMYNEERKNGIGVFFHNISTQNLTTEIVFNQTKDRTRGDVIYIKTIQPTKIQLYLFFSDKIEGYKNVSSKINSIFKIDSTKPIKIYKPPKTEKKEKQTERKIIVDPEKLLNTLLEKGSKACGPEAEKFNCGTPEDQGWMILAYNLGLISLEKPTLRIYLNQFAKENLETCGEANNYLCQTSIDTGIYLLSLSYLYHLKQRETYLDKINMLAAAGSEKCGPRVKQWRCTKVEGTAWMIIGYGAAYSVTGKTKYRTYMKKFADAGSSACAPGEDADCEDAKYQAMMIIAYSYAYNLTKDEKYKDFVIQLVETGSTPPTSFVEACGPKDDWNCGSAEAQALNIIAYALAYKLTGNDNIKEYLIKLADSDNEDCGPGKGFSCKLPAGQGLMISAYISAYQITGDKKYLHYATKLATTPTKVCGATNPLCEFPTDQAKLILGYSSYMDVDAPFWRIFFPCNLDICSGVKTTGSSFFYYLIIGIIAFIAIFVLLVIVRSFGEEEEEEEEEYEEEFLEETEAIKGPAAQAIEAFKNIDLSEFEDEEEEENEEYVEEDEKEEAKIAVGPREEVIELETLKDDKTKIVRTQTNEDAEKVRQVLEEVSDEIRVERVLTVNKLIEEVHDILAKHFKEYETVVDCIDEETLDIVALYRRGNTVFHYKLSEVSEDSCEIHFMVFGEDRKTVEILLQSVYRKLLK